MKTIIGFILIVLFSFSGTDTNAQTSARGFNYKAHQKKNLKAKRWSERRMKAARYDQVNVQCSVRKSRQQAKKSSRH